MKTANVAINGSSSKLTVHTITALYTLKSDTVAVIPRYYRGNGCLFHGSTAVVGNELSGVPRDRENFSGSTTVVVS